MPIQAEPDGTLDVENATLRSRNIVSLTNMVAGNDVVRSTAAPTLEVYGDPSNDGGVLPTLELVSNVDAAGSAFTRLTSNAGVFTIQSGTAGTADSKGDIAFSSIGGDTEHMRIQGSTGNVGIGAASPNAKLEVVSDSQDATSTPTPDSQIVVKCSNASGAVGTGGGITFAQRYFSGAGDLIATGGIFGARLGGTNGSYGGGLLFKTTASGGNSMSDRMVITRDGNVGIGITNALTKLHVNGTSGGMPNGYRRFFNYNEALTYNYSDWGNGISIFASSSILTNAFFVSHSGTINASDTRIKKNIVDADDAECLETLRLLKPKKYQYKDAVARGEEPVWGFIAQEVRETLPYATELRRDVLPNIYELANVSASNVITFTNFDTSTLESNAMVLKVYDVNDTEHLVNIAEVIDGHSIRVEEDLLEWTGSVDETGNVVSGNQLFVYGQEVDDFVFLKKEAIFTVATAALQEVDRQLQTEKAKVTTLETQLTSVLARLDALEGA